MSEPKKPKSVPFRSKRKAYSLIPHSRSLLRINATIGGNGGKVSEFRPRLLIDTGASYTFVSRRILQDLGYDLANPVSEESIVTGKGKIKVPVVNVSWFNCLGFTDINFSVRGCDPLLQLKLEGILGMDFLTAHRAVISVAEQKMYFLSASDLLLKQMKR